MAELAFARLDHDVATTKESLGLGHQCLVKRHPVTLAAAEVAHAALPRLWVVHRVAVVREHSDTGPQERETVQCWPRLAIRKDEHEVAIAVPCQPERQCAADVVQSLLIAREHHESRVVVQEHEPLRQRRHGLEWPQPRPELRSKWRRDLRPKPLALCLHSTHSVTHSFVRLTRVHIVR